MKAIKRAQRHTAEADQFIPPKGEVRSLFNEANLSLKRARNNPYKALYHLRVAHLYMAQAITACDNISPVLYMVQAEASIAKAIKKVTH